MAKKTPASQLYEPWLQERLAADPEEAWLYLEAALEDDDPRVFLVALKDIADAYGGLTKLAKTTGLNRENLYRMLSRGGNPEIRSLSRVLHALGLRLTIQPVSRDRAFRRRPRSSRRVVSQPLEHARSQKLERKHQGGYAKKPVKRGEFDR
jgi:probable addiction module antidote protein